MYNKKVDNHKKFGENAKIKRYPLNRQEFL